MPHPAPPPVPLDSAWTAPQQPSAISTGRLAAIACHYNPQGYRRLRENYFRFREALRGCLLFTIEVSFDGQFHLPADWQIRATERNLMWQKEALINAAVRRLPERFDQVAWIDADLLFLNPDWAAETSHILDEFPVVQLFETCHYIDAQGRWDHRHPSLLKKRREQLKEHGQPGGAWAARRDLLERHGLFDRNIVGGGDANFSDALFGVFSGYVTRISPAALNTAAETWARGLHQEVQGRVGCTRGDVLHLFHGTRQNRQYIDRAKMLCDAQYDPWSDVRLTPDGLLEWATDKPELQRQMRAYFEQRREDD